MTARLLWIVLTLALTGVAFSQNAAKDDQAIVALKVVDPSGAVIPGARVEAGSSEHDVGTMAVSDSHGQVVLHLQPGTYTVHVSAPGFKSWRRTNLELKRDSSVTLEVKLPVGEQSIGPVISAENILQPEPAEPLSAAISSEPLGRLDDLPRRKLPRHLRPRLAAN